MPAFANITIKKRDGTTDVIYTGVQPAAGDRSNAVWENQTIGTARSHRPTLRAKSQDNGAKTARRVDLAFDWPQTTTGSDGRVYVTDRASHKGSTVVPTNMTTANVEEFAYQMGNLYAAALIKSMHVDGYAPG